MKVPFVDFPASYWEIRDEVLPEIDRILTAGDLILRDDVEKFEKTLAEYTKTRFAVGLNSGTDALLLSLKALGIGQGDEVITSGYTFWATVEAIINCGATPILADIGIDLLIDAEDVRSKITNKTKAIIPVHIGGAVCDMDKIMAIANENSIGDIFVVEDTAQALGAYKPMGDIQTYSFYPAKVLGCYGDGGAITTNDEEVVEKIKLLRNHGGKPHSQFVGYNSRLDNLQATVLNIKIKYLDKMIKRRKEIAKIYDEELNDYQNNYGIRCFYPPKSITYQEYNLFVYDKRQKLYDFLKENEIETIIGDYTFPMEVPKNTIVANNSVLRLPIWPTLSDEQIKYVCEKIKEFFIEKNRVAL